MLFGLPITLIYAYVLVFGSTLKPNSTYQETTYRHGREVKSEIFHTVSAEKAKKRTRLFFSVGATALAGGLALVFWPNRNRHTNDDEEIALSSD